jgi:hypothetical protein
MSHGTPDEDLPAPLSMHSSSGAPCSPPFSVPCWPPYLSVFQVVCGSIQLHFNSGPRFQCQQVGICQRILIPAAPRHTHTDTCHR